MAIGPFVCPSCDTPFPIKLSKDGWPKEEHRCGTFPCSKCGTLLKMYENEDVEGEMHFYLTAAEAPMITRSQWEADIVQLLRSNAVQQLHREGVEFLFDGERPGIFIVN